MSSQRKKDHIKLAMESQTTEALNDKRFNYEPLMSPHPKDIIEPVDFLGKQMNYPIWVSSMTGGTPEAGIINQNLAKACKEFGLGMGLGSCRIWLDEKKYPEHFKLRPILGNDVPFYANLGIAQIEKALKEDKVGRINDMIDELEADGLFIHVNPLQEWLQPEGDFLTMKPIDAINEFAVQFEHKIIVKEVGQGMGKESLRELLYSDLEGIEFAAFGGTNFATLELKRGNEKERELLEPLSYVGNAADEMLGIINDIISEDVGFPPKQLIISGGVKTFLDGYYLISKSKIPAVYGQAGMFLKYASGDYQTLKEFIELQIKGLEFAFAYLDLKDEE